MDQAPVLIDSNLGLHAKEPLAHLAGAVHSDSLAPFRSLVEMGA